MYYVYILQDEGQKIYIGYSSNLKRRITEHQRGNTTTTKRMVNPILVYYEAYQHEHAAREREQKLKQYGSAYQGLLKRIGLR